MKYGPRDANFGMEVASTIPAEQSCIQKLSVALIYPTQVCLNTPYFITFHICFRVRLAQKCSERNSEGRNPILGLTTYSCENTMHMNSTVSW